MLERIIIKVKDFFIIFSGMALKELQKFNDAIMMYEMAIKINPNYANAYVNKGESFQHICRSCTETIIKI